MPLSPPAAPPTQSFRFVHLVVVVLAVATVYEAWLLHERGDGEGPQPILGATGTMPVGAVAPTLSPTLATLTDQARALVTGHDSPQGALQSVAAVRADIAAGNFAKAHEVLARVRATPLSDPWDGGLEGRVLTAIAEPGNRAFAARLDEWVRRAPRSFDAHYLRAVEEQMSGWLMRGSHFVRYTSRGDMRGFGTLETRALRDYQQASLVAPSDPLPVVGVLSIFAGTGGAKPASDYFGVAIQRFPGNYSLDQEELSALAPKWGGSVAEMIGFVDGQTSGAAPDSPLWLLYVDLYGHLLNAGVIHCSHGGHLNRQCFDKAMQQGGVANVGREAETALRREPAGEHAAFTHQVFREFAALVPRPSAFWPSMHFLDVAAQTLKSDPQISARRGRDNSYAIDAVAGNEWNRQGDTTSANFLWKRAVTDLNDAKPGSVEGPQAARSWLFESIAGAYGHNGHWRKAAIYAIAANLLASPTGGAPSVTECQALYQLSLYQDAVAVCTTVIEEEGSAHARWWRAAAFEKESKLRQMQADLVRLSNSESALAGPAVLWRSSEDAKSGHIHRMLHTLKSYPFIFDQQVSDPFVVAGAYNNLCFGEMRIGELHRALLDCQESLHHRWFPDAVEKLDWLRHRLHQDAPPPPPPVAAGGINS